MAMGPCSKKRTISHRIIIIGRGGNATGKRGRMVSDGSIEKTTTTTTITTRPCSREIRRWLRQQSTMNHVVDPKKEEGKTLVRHQPGP